MGTYDKEDKKVSDAWIKAYTQISNLTGIKLEDTVNHSYGIVVIGDKKSELFGKIGVYEKSEESTNYFRFGKKRIGFDREKDEIYWATNPIMLLEEREKLFKLF